MEFLLQYLAPKRRNEHAFQMIGGPLIRYWTADEWNDWVIQQRPAERPFYEKWAEEAQAEPYKDVVRDLK